MEILPTTTSVKEKQCCWIVISIAKKEKMPPVKMYTGIMCGKKEVTRGSPCLGDIFSNYGAKKTFLNRGPTAANLKKASIYIIVDPDTKRKPTT